MKPSSIIDPPAIVAYNAIRDCLSGLTLQQAHDAISAAHGFINVLADNVDDPDAFRFE